MDAPKLPEQEIRVQRTVSSCFRFSAWTLALLNLAACASLPEVKQSKHKFPKNVYIAGQAPADRKYDVVGWVRAKVDYPTLDPNHEEAALCRNYFNKAAEDLLRYAKEKGADAVVEMKSVVVMVDGKTEEYPRAECTDEGSEGQVLAKGLAIKWKPLAEQLSQDQDEVNSVIPTQPKKR